MSQFNINNFSLNKLFNDFTQQKQNQNTSQAQNQQNTQNQQNSQNTQNTKYFQVTQYVRPDSQSTQNVNQSTSQNTTQSHTSLNNSQTQNAQNTQNNNSVFVYNLETAKMDQQVVQKYLQNLLNMPKTLEELVQNTQNNTSQNTKIDAKTYQFLKIFVQNLINTETLAEIMNQNSKDAIQKLLNTMSVMLKSGSKNSSQLKEMLSVLNAIQASTSSQSSGVLKDLLLLYIPVNSQMYFEKDNFSIDETQEMAINQNALSILFETLNFSNILATINEDSNNLFLAIFAKSDFAFSRFKNIISTVAKEKNINVVIDFKNLNQNNKKEEKPTQNFKIIANKLISSNALLLSQIIVKTIFSMDDNYNKNQE